MLLQILFHAGAMISIISGFISFSHGMLYEDIPAYTTSRYPSSVASNSSDYIKFDGSVLCHDSDWNILDDTATNDCFTPLFRGYHNVPQCERFSTSELIKDYYHIWIFETGMIVGGSGLCFVILLTALHDILAYFDIHRARKVIRHVLIVLTCLLIAVFGVLLCDFSYSYNMFSYRWFAEMTTDDVLCDCLCIKAHSDIDVFVLFGLVHVMVWKVFMIMRVQKDGYLYNDRMYTIQYPIPVECANRRVTEGNMWRLVNVEELEDTELKLPEILRKEKRSETRCFCGNWRVAAFRLFYFLMICLSLLTVYDLGLFIMYNDFRIFGGEEELSEQWIIWFTILFETWAWSTGMLHLISLQLAGWDLCSSLFISLLGSLLIWHVLNMSTEPQMYDHEDVLHDITFPKRFYWIGTIIFYLSCFFTTFFWFQFRYVCKTYFPHFYKYIQAMHRRDKIYEMLIFPTCFAMPWCISYVLCRNNNENEDSKHLSELELTSDKELEVDCWGEISKYCRCLRKWMYANQDTYTSDLTEEYAGSPSFDLSDITATSSIELRAREVS